MDSMSSSNGSGSDQEVEEVMEVWGNADMAGGDARADRSSIDREFQRGMELTHQQLRSQMRSAGDEGRSRPTEPAMGETGQNFREFTEALTDMRFEASEDDLDMAQEELAEQLALSDAMTRCSDALVRIPGWETEVFIELFKVNPASRRFKTWRYNWRRESGEGSGTDQGPRGRRNRDMQLQYMSGRRATGAIREAWDWSESSTGSERERLEQRWVMTSRRQWSVRVAASEHRRQSGQPWSRPERYHSCNQRLHQGRLEQ